MGSPAEYAIVAAGLTKRYGGFTAVDRLDLNLTRGEVFGLLGPNGAGKTTTILMLLGLTEPTEGESRVEGHDPVRDPLAVKRLVGYLPDNVGFYPNLTGRQNLRYTADLNGLTRREAPDRIDALLSQVGLQEAADKRAGTYSRGMRQRLGIADALVKDPRILILDEPTIGIDPEGVRELLALIRHLSHQRGMTILLSSHLLSQVQAVCDQVGIFIRGRLIATGPVDTLGRRIAGEDGFEIEVQAYDPREAAPANGAVGSSLADIPGVREVGAEDTMWVVHAERDVRPLIPGALAAHGLVAIHLRLRGQSLDDVYGQYFHGETGVNDA